MLAYYVRDRRARRGQNARDALFMDHLRATLRPIYVTKKRGAVVANDLHSRIYLITGK